jgi:hypothetical protein
MKTAQIVRDRAAIQMALIDNAALAYYINNGAWPGQQTSGCTAGMGLSVLASYLPAQFTNPFIGLGAYSLTCSTNQAYFTVSLNVRANQDAEIIAGMVPGGVANVGLHPSVSSSVNIPGQNLNNARAVNAAGVYHNGACVPVPVCPTGMTPQIYVGVAQIMGTNDAASSNPNLYPITNFTAYAIGGTTSSPGPCTGANQSSSSCYNYGPSETLPSGVSSRNSPSPPNYWRVCVDVGTQAGDIASNASNTGGTSTTSWGQYQSLLAITRCAPGTPLPTENSGSDLNVWTP